LHLAVTVAATQSLETFMKLSPGLGIALLSCVLCTAPVSAQETFATTMTNAFRGEAAGSMPGWYGGQLFGAYPVALNEAEVSAAVIGAPDTAFVSLPGVGPQPAGTAFRGAYVEVEFGQSFTANTTLKLYETLRSSEEATIWLWFSDGGFLQLSTNPAVTGDVYAVDLRPYASVVAVHGGVFTRVGVGGLDSGGGSQGFDLDAVSITPVPEPATAMLMALGLGMVAAVGRRRR
jgi:hypothetical protein